MDIEWIEPTSVGEALDLAGRYGEEAKVVAGGTWLTMVLRQGMLMPSALISLRRLDELRQIRYEPGVGLRLGALASVREVELSGVVRTHVPALAATFGQVANVRVRNQATVGGNLCDADYASDPPAMLAALQSRARLESAQGGREVPVEGFITGHYETVIRPGELLTEVVVPEPRPNTAAVYLKYRARSSEDRPCLGVAAVASFDDERVEQLRVVVGAVAGTPQVVPDALTVARGERLTPALIERVAADYAAAIDPLSDLRGSAWYRSQMIGVYVRRALQALAGDAAGGTR